MQINMTPEIFEEIISANSDGVFAVDTQYKIIYWSKAMERLSHLPQAQVLKQNIFDLLPLLKMSDEKNCYQQAFDGKKIFTQNDLYIAPSSNKKGFFKNYYSPLSATCGKIIGAIVNIRDLSEQRDAENIIQESEDRFRTMSDCAPVALWMSRKDGMCDYFNKGWLEFTGRSLEEEIGVGWADRIHPEDFQKAMDTYFMAFNVRKPFTMEYRLQRYDGEFRWLLDNGRPRYTKNGEFLGYIGSCIDITDQKMAFEKLSYSARKIEAALHMRDDFICTASHELNTPLTPLKLHLHTIKTRLLKVKDLPSSFKEDLLKITNAMNSQINYVTKIIKNMLDVTRISFQKIKLDIEELDLVHIIRESIEQYELLMPKNRFKFYFANEQCMGQWDKVRIKQIIDNIINNAVKYGANKTIEVQLLEDEKQVKLSIRDNGIGIPKKSLEAIFDKFERAVSTENYSGLGLGLYIVKQNVLLHGGSIAVESNIGKGSTFTIILPKLGNNTFHEVSSSMNETIS